MNMSHRRTIRARVRPRLLHLLTIACVAIGVPVALAGCFEIEVKLSLNEDLSGTLENRVTIDTKPMLYMMAAQSKLSSGETGPVTDAELLAIQEMMNFEETTTNVGNLPDGVRLLSLESRQEDFKMHMEMALEFDDIEKLRELESAEPEAAPSGEPPSTPFQGFQLIDEGDTFLLTTELMNPMEDQPEDWEQGWEVSPEAQAILRSALGGLRIAFVIQAPFEVVEHNAHRLEGDTLTWEFTEDSLVDPAQQMPTQIRVRYRKSL